MENFSEKQLYLINGIFRIHSIADTLFNLYEKSITNTNTTTTYTLESLDLYEDFCCRLFDIIEVIQTAFSSFTFSKKLLLLTSKKYKVEDEIIKKYLNIPNNECNLYGLLKEYRNFYTHPNLAENEYRLNKIVFFKVYISEETIYELWKRTQSIIEYLKENTDEEKLIKKLFSTDKSQIIKIKIASEKISAITENLSNKKDKIS